MSFLVNKKTYWFEEEGRYKTRTFLKKKEEEDKNLPD
ncbi:hypothetical protein CCACVL1_01019 [Corchorus capsularis]|uniref:Uncharacterized protein n=1 Tax=Corchorus capsularis TaxID=210143 RepID=A0A1R3KSF6_COCAP|nr:hypothetical protein CCACVL1_01019 [Corchorus capsularis]